ncbi:MAG: cytochrome c biogenesis protein CcdA [Chloroflexi bacterium]|nr:cytochrome c biogenesis protein CcdA [Chloroflexota bacterium]
MVAAVNPCGFALLPAYLGLYLGGGDDPGAHRHPHRRFLQAVRVSVMVSASFVLLFGAVGLILGVVSSAAARYFPWVGLAVGVLLVFTGGRMLGGGTLYSSIGERMADRVGASARQNSYRGYFAYGLAYGSASLGCTLPIFLTVVGTTLTASGFLSAALQFVLYGLGMGFVITVLTVSTAFFKHAAIARARRTVRYVRLAGSALLLVAGAYIIYYWLTLGGLLFRIPLS